jgi:hypothetical protein
MEAGHIIKILEAHRKKQVGVATLGHPTAAPRQHRRNQVRPLFERAGRQDAAGTSCQHAQVSWRTISSRIQVFGAGDRVLSDVLLGFLVARQMPRLAAL